MGAERKSAVVAEENRKLTAYHEGGHALVALFTEGARPGTRRRSCPEVSPSAWSCSSRRRTTEPHQETAAGVLDVTMGGRVAGELIFGESEVTTGASSDLRQATRLARR